MRSRAVQQREIELDSGTLQILDERPRNESISRGNLEDRELGLAGLSGNGGNHLAAGRDPPKPAVEPAQIEHGRSYFRRGAGVAVQ